MAIWLVRAGPHGEYEQKFIQEKRVYVTWDDLAVDLGKMKDRSELLAAMETLYPDSKPKARINWASQIWPFAHGMQAGDLVVVPLKSQPAICIGEITGDYQFDAAGSSPYFHYRKVKWIGESIPRSHFGKDLLFSFGAFMTICRVQRNNAEARIAAMRANGWKAEALAALTQPESADVPDADTGIPDLEVLARDQIAQERGPRNFGQQDKW